MQKHEQTQKATRNAKHDGDTNSANCPNQRRGDDVFLARKYLGEKKDRLKGSKKEMPNKKKKCITSTHLHQVAIFLPMILLFSIRFTS